MSLTNLPPWFTRAFRSHDQRLYELERRIASAAAAAVSPYSIGAGGFQWEQWGAGWGAAPTGSHGFAPHSGPYGGPEIYAYSPVTWTLFASSGTSFAVDAAGKLVVPSGIYAASVASGCAGTDGYGVLGFMAAGIDGTHSWTQHQGSVRNYDPEPGDGGGGYEDFEFGFSYVGPLVSLECGFGWQIGGSAPGNVGASAQLTRLA
jgi:hypothetical protein